MEINKVMEIKSNKMAIELFTEEKIKSISSNMINESFLVTVQ